MGCDIHMYIEYSDKETTPGKEKYWHSFGTRMNPGRNYLMFGILAGVRCDTDFSYEPKGVPEDLGYYASSDHWIYISETGGDGCATPEQAKKWGGKMKYDKDGKPTHVEDPDAHSHSYLTPQEYCVALNFYNKELQKEYGDAWEAHRPIEYTAVLAAMNSLQSFGKDVRVVFWFDN